MRNEHTQTAYEVRIAEMPGDDLYGRLKSLRAELAEHPDRSMAIAYLM